MAKGPRLPVPVALAKEYGNGLRDGIKLTLEQILARAGDPAYQHGAAYMGPMPEELRRWAEDVLERATAVDGDAAEAVAREVMQ